MKKIEIFLKETSTIKFIISITALSYLIFIPLIPFMQMFLGSPTEDIFIESVGNIGLLFVGASIIAPILETLIFQYGILKILKRIKFLQNKNFLNILISAIIFSLAHTPNWGYRIFAFVMGMLLAYAFIIYEERQLYNPTKISSFWVLVIIHSLRNTISVTLCLI